jgi:hypothetical protein
MRPLAVVRRKRRRRRSLLPERSCDGPGCEARFIPHNRASRFHSTRCHDAFHNAAKAAARAIPDWWCAE